LGDFLLAILDQLLVQGLGGVLPLPMELHLHGATSFRFGWVNQLNLVGCINLKTS
jgi:hypothetical protein